MSDQQTSIISKSTSSVNRSIALRNHAVNKSSLNRGFHWATGLAAFVFCGFSSAAAPEVISLWPGGAPGFEDRRDEAEKAESYWVKNIHNPSITAFLPSKEKAMGVAVIICPGGGHRELVFNAEGVEAAEFFNSIGVAAFALKYRLGREADSPYVIEKHAKQDGQRAMRLVRSRAAEWGIDPQKIGIMGFSAGGEVVSLVSYGETQGKAQAKDFVERASCRPDFQIYIYPGHLGIPDTIASDAPQTFLLTANDDGGAAKNIQSLYEKLRAAEVPLEAHIYQQGGHAFNMGNRSKLVSLQKWPQRVADWMTDNIFE